MAVDEPRACERQRPSARRRLVGRFTDTSPSAGISRGEASTLNRETSCLSFTSRGRKAGNCANNSDRGRFDARVPGERCDVGDSAAHRLLARHRRIGDRHGWSVGG